MRVRSLAPLIGLGLLLVVAVAVPASAQATVTISPNPVPFAPEQTSQHATVEWTGQTPEKLIYVDICRKVSTDPSFQPGLDCAPLSSQTPNGNATGAGTIQVEIFRGPEPSGDLPWGCFADGDTAPAGIEKNTTCYVRVTNNSLFNNNQAVDQPFTLVESGGVIPEAPLTVLLPTLGAVVALGGFFLIRRRSALA